MYYIEKGLHLIALVIRLNRLLKSRMTSTE